MDFFDITNYEFLGDIHFKQKYWVIEFTEKNELLNANNSNEYESKGFMQIKLIQDFPLIDKAVF